MTEHYYSINIRLKPDDKKNLDKLLKKGATIISVLRDGISAGLKKK